MFFLDVLASGPYNLAFRGGDLVDRIDKLRETDYLRVDASDKSEKDPKQEESQQQDSFAGLNDKTDWKLLLDKSKLWKKNIQIPQDEIESLVYRKVNLKTDPSFLRIDITLKTGEKIAPAFLAVSRLYALKIKDLKSGDQLQMADLTQNESLLVTVPLNPEMFKDEAIATVDKKEKPETLDTDITVTQHVVDVKKVFETPEHKTSPEIYMIYGVIIFIILLILGSIIFLR